MPRICHFIALGCLSLLWVETQSIGAPSIDDQRAQAQQDADRLTEELKSADPERIAAAKSELWRSAKGIGSFPYFKLKPLYDAGMYDDVEKLGFQLSLTRDGSRFLGTIENLRALSFMKDGKWQEASVAAKLYYNCASLEKTADAVAIVGQCLTKLPDNGAALAEKFQAQQAAWESVETTQPSSELGLPVLESIKIDGKPYESAIDRIRGSDYLSLQRKGNLFLAADRGADARKAFEEALELASEKQKTQAIGDVARAIRTENGCIGPANAYLRDLRKTQ